MSRPIIELEKEVHVAPPQRPYTPILRAKHSPIFEAGAFAFILLSILILGIVTGMKIAAPEEIRRQRAWDVQVAIYNECFNKFVKPIPLSAREIRMARSASCLDVAEVVLNEVYQAAGRKP